MRLPTWGELHDEQKIVWEQGLDRSLFVVGPPGSGKTSLAAHRARMCASQAAGCFVVTYNRMLRRLVTLLDGQSHQGRAGPSPSVDMRTMDSFVGWDWRVRFPDEDGNLPNYPSGLHDWDVRVARLAREGINPRRGHIVVDEGQDLPPWFFRYVAQVSNTITVFADSDQAVAEDGSSLKEIKRGADLPDPFLLSKNHRNTPEIATVAEHFHDGDLPPAAVVRPPTGDVPRLLRLDGQSETVDWVARWFRQRGGTVGVIARDNRTVDGLRTTLAERLPGAAVHAYTHGSRNEDRIDVTKPGITVLNVSSAKGQEFDTVFVAELEKFLPPGSPLERRRMYMMCTRARDHLFLVQHRAGLLGAVERSLPGPEILLRR